MKTKYNLATFIEARRAAESIPIELSDGSVVLIPPPMLWPDEFKAAAVKSDKRKMLTLILGEDDAKRFSDDGGTYAILDAIYTDAQDADMGESSASS